MFRHRYDAEKSIHIYDVSMIVNEKKIFACVYVTMMILVVQCPMPNLQENH